MKKFLALMILSTLSVGCNQLTMESLNEAFSVEDIKSMTQKKKAKAQDLSGSQLESSGSALDSSGKVLDNSGKPLAVKAYCKGC